MTPIPLPDLARTFWTLLALQRLHAPGSDERNHILEARLLLMSEAIKHHGADATGRAWNDAIQGVGHA